MVTSEQKTLGKIESPDFYWQYRLDRLALKKAGDVSFKATNYPEAVTSKELYDAYYLDLTLQGKLDGFDWVTEKTISDAEWLAIYKSMCQWTAKTSKDNKPSTASLPTNDFDLLKQFYPQLNFRDLDTPFAVEEVGNNFPYKNLKDLLSAAGSGNLNIPNLSSVSSLEAAEIRKEVTVLKDKTMKRVDEIYESALSFAKSPFPDEQSRKHYQSLKAELATFPQTPEQWASYRSTIEKQVDEMATLAAKLDEPEHHDHHEGESALSPAQEFESKYGKNLNDLQEMMSKYKQNPEGFFESSILEKYGKTGLEILTKSQEFSSKLTVLNDSDKVQAESDFKKFLSNA